MNANPHQNDAGVVRGGAAYSFWRRSFMMRFAGETRAAPIVRSARPSIFFSVRAPVGQEVMDGGSLGHVRDPVPSVFIT
jgi:hypothetical protein